MKQIKCKQEDLDAFNECITDRWEYFAGIDGKDPLEGAERCSLCILDDTKEGFACDNCVIYRDTHQSSCSGTPYEIWANSKEAWGIDDQNTLNCAIDMLDYLKDLKSRLIIGK